MISENSFQLWAAITAGQKTALREQRGAKVAASVKRAAKSN
jgi:hypothetical protein